ncbi:MAG: YciI family protein [Lautropia sp.]
MQYALLIYTDDALLQQLPAEQIDAHLRDCFGHFDELQAAGRLHGSQQLEPPAAARSVRIRGGRTAVLDGPFAETKEMLAGFNLIEADSIEEAVRVAESLPWARFGCIEVRPVRDLAAVRRRVGVGAGA